MESNEIENKTKKLLFGLIEMNGTLYNILYTIWCSFIILIISSGCILLLNKSVKGTGVVLEISAVMLISIILYIIASKLFDKNNYI